MEHLPYIFPKSPDPYLVALGSNKAQAALARLAHLNPLIDRINLLQDLIDSTETGITAFAGGGQTNATQLTATYNEVTVVASAGDSVKLLAAVEGLKQIVKNDGANNLAVFPATGDTIDDGTVNASITIAPGATVTFSAVDGTNWETSDKSISVGKTLFVDVTYGSNTTAKPYDPAYPYATIAAAVTAATSGDLIWVRPGTYPVSTNLLKEGVSFYCDKGVTITNTSNMFNADTTAGGTTLTLPFFFLGHAILTDANAGGGGFIQIRTNPNAFINAEFDSVTSSNISNAMVIRDGTFNLKVRGNFTSAGRSFNFRDTGNLFATIDGIVTCTFGNNANAVIYSSGMTWDGVASIKAKTFSVPAPTASQAVIWLDTVVNGKLTVDLDYYIDASAVTFPFINLAAGTTTCQTILNINFLNVGTRSLYSIADADHKLFINAPVVTSAGGTCSAGLVVLNGGQYVTTATFLTSGGISSFSNIGINGSAASVVPATISSGTLNLIGTVLTTDGTDESINQSGGTVVALASNGTTRASISAGIFTGTYLVNNTNTQQIAGPIVHIGEQLLTGAGAVDLTSATTRLVTTGADALTLANGTDGQEKYIFMDTFGGAGTLTPASSLGYTTITFGADGDSVLLQFNSAAGAWIIKGSFGAVIA